MTAAPPVPGTHRGNDLEDLRLEILRRITPILRAAEVEEHEVDCTIAGAPARLLVVLSGPPRASALREALSVRVHDAVRADGRTFGPVAVQYHFGEV